MTKQSGFSIGLIFIALAVASVVGYLVWRGLANHQTLKNTVSETSTFKNETPNPNQGYIVIHEWGIRFKPVSGLVGVIYAMTGSDSRGDNVQFSTQAFADYSAECSAAVDATPPFGRLVRLKAPREEFPPTPDNGGGFIKKIEDHYYMFVTPQASCTDDMAIANSQLHAYNTLFKPSIATLEATE